MIIIIAFTLGVYLATSRKLLVPIIFVVKVSIGSSIISVDSTVGFAKTGMVISGINSITYSDKSVNQFIGCTWSSSSGSNEDIIAADNIRSDEIYFGFEDGDLSKRVEIRLTGVLSEFQQVSNILKVSEGDIISVNNIGDLMIHEKDLVNKILFNLQRHLILCEKNTGNWSVENINDIVIGKTKPYDFKALDEGLPIMCTKNNNQLGISNGDIGVLIGINENRKYLFRKFNDNNELIVELIDPSALENVVPAIAITIHKSQGSESEKVSILWSKKSKLPESINRAEKENKNIFFRDNYEKRLLYTAITRAKKLLDIYYLN